MRTLSLSLVMLLSLASCGVGVEPAETGMPVVKKSDALVSLSAPVEFTRVRALLPATGVQSCYVYVLGDPRAPTRDFVAWGFDPMTGQALFFVHGNILESLGAFNAMLTANLAGYINPASDLPFFHGGGNQWPKVGPNPGPSPAPGGDWTSLSRQAYGATHAIYQAHLANALH